MAKKKKNKFSKVLAISAIVTVILIIVIIIITFFVVKRTADTPDEQVIGGQQDEYGCLTAAGYSWCEASQKCLRTWEEACGDQSAEITTQLQAVFAQKYNKQPEEVIITISDYTDRYARGSVKFDVAGPGGLFLATKEGDTWQPVFDGNGSYSCESVAGFPAEMISDCAPTETQTSIPAENLTACQTNDECIPLPSECHPLKCINKEFEDQFAKPEVCTELFSLNAAYTSEDCQCLNNVCTNKNNL